jgi:hypothetical protein
MAAARVDLTIEQGALFTRIFRYRDPTGAAIPLALWLPKMVIRRDGFPVYDSGTADTDLGGITLAKEPAGATGDMWVTIASDITAGLFLPFNQPAAALTYRLDLTPIFDDGTSVVRLLVGRLLIDREDSM